MDQTAVTKMIGRSKTPGDSDTRHSTPKPNNQRYSHCIADGTTKQSNPSSWIQYPNKPHLNVTLDKTHKIKALVDSGSAISLADLSTLDHITNKATGGPPISMTSCHNNRVNSRGCYEATIYVDKDLPHPTGAKQIRVHIINNLSSELILGNDFLRENGAVINLRDNSVTFSPKGTTAIARSGSQILQETAMVFGEGTTPYEDLVDNHQNTYTLHPKETKPLGQMDQITFHAKNKTDTSTIFKPGTTVMITSSLTTTPCVPDGLYSTKDNNMVQITIRNTEMYPIKLIESKPITGITVHLLDKYYNRTSKPEDTLRTYPGENMGLTHEHYPSECTPKQHWENKNLQHDIPLLNPGINNPGMRKHPILGPSTMVTKNLPVQFDIKDVKQDRIPVYQQIIPCGDNVHLRNKSDMGHIPHHHYRIERTTDQPIRIHHYKTSVAAEHAWDELVTNPTATHTLIEQPNIRNTPIFMVAIKDGQSVGTGRFVQNFRKRNTAYQDDEDITQNSRKSPTVTGAFKPRICSQNDFISTACGPPLEKSPQGVTFSKSPSNNTQCNRTRTLRDPMGIGKFLSRPRQFQMTKEGANHENDLITTTITYKKMQEISNTIFTDYPLHKVKLRPNKSILKQKEPVWLGYSTKKLHKITLRGRPQKPTNTLGGEVKNVPSSPERIQIVKGTGPLAKAGRHNVTKTISSNSGLEGRTFPFRVHTVGWTPRQPLSKGIRVGPSPGAGLLTVVETVSTRSIQEICKFPCFAKVEGLVRYQPLAERTGLVEGVKLLSGTGLLTITGAVSAGSIQEICTFPSLAQIKGLTFIFTRMSTLMGAISISIYGPAVIKLVVRCVGTSVGTSEADWKFALKHKNMVVNPLWSTENQEINKQVQHHNTTPTHKNTRLYMDIMGPLITRRGRKHILAITNTFTQYAELVEIPKGETVTVTQALLDQWIVRHGFYEQVISDHGRTIASKWRRKN